MKEKPMEIIADHLAEVEGLIEAQQLLVAKLRKDYARVTSRVWVSDKQRKQNAEVQTLNSFKLAVHRLEDLEEERKNIQDILEMTQRENDPETH